VSAWNKYRAKKVRYCFRCSDALACKKCGYPLTEVVTCTHGGAPDLCPRCNKKDEVKIFDSKLEYNRYCHLRLLEAYGDISDLKLQTPFPIIWPGSKSIICTYIADFTYIKKSGERVVEDTKGFKTPIYKLKKKLVRDAYGVTILET